MILRASYVLPAGCKYCPAKMLSTILNNELRKLSAGSRALWITSLLIKTTSTILINFLFRQHAKNHRGDGSMMTLSWQFWSWLNKFQTLEGLSSIVMTWGNGKGSISCHGNQNGQWNILQGLNVIECTSRSDIQTVICLLEKVSGQELWNIHWWTQLFSFQKQKHMEARSDIPISMWLVVVNLLVKAHRASCKAHHAGFVDWISPPASV